MSRLPALFLLAGLLLFAGCAKQQDDSPRVTAAAPEHVPKVVRLAPDFAIQSATVRSARGLRGQAIVLIIADSPKTKAFRKQLKKLADGYSEFASRQTVFVAAFRNGTGPVESNVPFALAANGTAVAAAYGVKDDMNVVIIAPDGNVDYQTNKVLPAGRIRDVIQNSYSVQASRRK
jgi:hypothetical protein